jgi:peroxiredoxin
MGRLVSIVPALACLLSLNVTAAPPRPGDPAPPLGLTRLLQAPEGQEATLESLRGRVVVLEFWYTTCMPCVSTGLPHMNRLAEAFAGRPVTFISITYESESVVGRFTERIPIRTWIGLDENRAAFKAYDVDLAPTTFIIGKDGRVVASAYPTEVTEGVLNHVLAGEPSGIDTDKSARFEAERLRADEREPEVSIAVRVLSAKPSNSELAAPISTDSLGFECFGTTVAFTLSQLTHIPERRVEDSSLADGRWLKIEARVPRAPGEAFKEADRRRRDLVVAAMEQALHLKISLVRRPTQALVVRPGPDWRTKVRPPSVRPSLMNTDGRFVGMAVPLGAVCIALSDHLDIPVVAELPADGKFDIEFSWTPGDTEDLKRAVCEQVGLELSLETREIEYVVVTKSP